MVLEVGDDLFIKVEKPWGERPLSMEFETGGGVSMSVDLTPETARDLAVCLDWAAPTGGHTARRVTWGCWPRLRHNEAPQPGRVEGPLETAPSTGDVSGAVRVEVRDPTRLR